MHKATVSIFIGHREVLVEVEFEYTPEKAATWHSPTEGSIMDIVSGSVLAKAYDGRRYDVCNRAAPDWLIQALREDYIDGGPIYDALTDAALAQAAE
jgi:hypothetical protein